jgi:hypothetical protein
MFMILSFLNRHKGIGSLRPHCIGITGKENEFVLYPNKSEHWRYQN